jgi:transposase-like protein
VEFAVFVVAATACSTGIAMRFVASALRARCPRCSRKQLVYVPESGCDSLYARYRCTACASHWVACKGGLVAREAFAAGARDPFPTAMLRR